MTIQKRITSPKYLGRIVLVIWLSLPPPHSYLTGGLNHNLSAYSS